MTNSTNDILEAWKGEIQELRRNQEASEARAVQNGRRASRAALEAHEASETARRTQETVQGLTAALESAKARLEKMHAPGCLRTGWGCEACEGLDDLAGY